MKKVIYEKNLENYKNQKYNINMERGWPCKEQLDLSMPMLDMVTSKDSLIFESDYRGYSGTGGILPAKKLFAEILDVGPENVYVGGTMSTTLMYDIIDKAVHFGLENHIPWGHDIKFICPSPGYEKHFKICERFGIEMIPVSIKEDGPDMDQVEELVKKDKQIKGIWCVPLYSNPTGSIYSDETVYRLARMKAAATDFRIFWDHAYCVHHLSEVKFKILNILTECEKAGNENRVFIFTSTSKITFPGGGMAACASSLSNINWLTKESLLQLKTGDKINQLRHCWFLRDLNGVEKHMEKHRKIIGPKFDLVEHILEEEFQGSSIVDWKKPKGGYFFTLRLLPSMAGKVVKICEDLGVRFTPAGSIFPYGRDTKDQYIRIAPTYPEIGELEVAMRILCNAIKLIYAQEFGERD